MGLAGGRSFNASIGMRCRDDEIITALLGINQAATTVKAVICEAHHAAVLHWFTTPLCLVRTPRDTDSRYRDPDCPGRVICK
jgi:hypothetical protein